MLEQLLGSKAEETKKILSFTYFKGLPYTEIISEYAERYFRLNLMSKLGMHYFQNSQSEQKNTYFANFNFNIDISCVSIIDNKLSVQDKYKSYILKGYIRECKW